MPSQTRTTRQSERRFVKPAGALLVSVALTGAALVAPTTAEASSDDCARFPVALTRLVRPDQGTTLLSQFPSEIASASAFGFRQNDGEAMQAAQGPGTGLVAVWRAYNPSTSDFTWAAEGSDLAAVEKDGYGRQFVQFYAAGADSECTSSAYRMAKGDTTRIVVGTAEKDSLAAAGWTVAAAGVFYTPTAPETTPPTPADPPPAPAPGPQPAGGEFTIGVFPDTQVETWNDSDQRIKNRSAWLRDNASALNLKFVTHVGDVVDWGVASPQQFVRADNGLAPLVGRVPLSLTIGNHDTAAVCAGGSACPGVSANAAVRDTTAFNNTFEEATFTNLRGQYEAGKVDNTFHTFSAEGTDWLVLNLELWPRAGAVAWARQVVESHPRHNVVVATHAYLEADGSISGSAGGYGATSPRYLWDNLIKVYPNIKLVLSGHVGSSTSRVDTGDHGNKILSLLQCFHDRSTNPTRLVKINPAAGSITHWVYAPLTDRTMVGAATQEGFDFTP